MVEILTSVRKLELITQFEKGGEHKPTEVFDLTGFCGSSQIILEEEDIAISKLSFKLIHNALLWIDVIALGQVVQLKGGQYTDFGSVIYKTFFRGVVTAIHPVFPDNGKAELEVIAEDYKYMLTLKSERIGPITYPGETASKGWRGVARKFNVAKQLSLSQIVRGILNEYREFFKVKELKIDPALDFLFTLKDSISQHAEESDFDFVLRILTGRSSTVPFVSSKKEEKYINARASFFLEIDPEEQISSLYIASEHYVKKHVNKIHFVYQGEDSVIIPPQEYNLARPDSRLDIKGVQIRNNPDFSTGADVFRIQDASVKDIGAGGRMGSLEKKKLPKGGIKQEIGSPLLFFQQYEVDEEKVSRALKEGKLKVKDLASFTKKEDWKSLRVYFKRKKVVFESSARQMTKQIKDQEYWENKRGDLRKGEVQEEKIDFSERAFMDEKGEFLSFHTHGNIFVSPRQMFRCYFPVTKYKGLWYMWKVTHIFGDTYRVQCDLKR